MTEPTFHIKVETEKPGFGKFSIEPLDQGYGQTLGNSIRRVLLASLPGAAISSVKIAGVKHQFSTLEGMKEDVVEFIMNLKKVRLTIEGSEPVKMTISKKGPGEVLAADIDVPSGVTIVNPDLVLANLADKKVEFEIELTADKGYGYVSADEKHITEVGVIPMDSLYSPVTRVNYRVEATRVGRMTNLDRLVLEIWTDGTISAGDALKSSAKILVSYFMQVVEPKAQGVPETVAVTPAISDEVLKMRIEELDIPTRIVNALANGGIETIGQLLGTQPADLMKIKNLGIKSLAIVEEKLREKGVALAV
jgi:DNA-directed RNA polymerase subunit alpha